MRKNSKGEASLDNSMNRYVKSIIGFALSKNGVVVLVSLFFILIIILTFSNDKGLELKSENDGTEKKLGAIIGQIEGVERAEVMITYEQAGVDEKPEEVTNGTGLDISPGKKTQEAKTVLKAKEIKGVIVVAKGADDYLVKLNIIDAVKTGLNIDKNKVEVLNMK